MIGFRRRFEVFFGHFWPVQKAEDLKGTGTEALIYAIDMADERKPVHQSSALAAGPLLGRFQSNTNLDF